MSTLTFDDADRLIDSKPHLDCRKVANNTYIRRLPSDDIAVRLHDTDIIVIRQDNTYLLDSGGWRTVTTKQRINSLTPARIWQERNVWYMWPGKLPFFDGIIVGTDGRATEPMDTAALKAIEANDRVEKLINKYIVALRKLKELPKPRPGDCWGCLMISTSNADRAGLKMGMQPDGKVEYPLGSDCVMGHLEETYVHGSLIIRALRARGTTEYAIALYYQEWNERGWAMQCVTRAVRTFLRAEAQKILRSQSEVAHD